MIGLLNYARRFGRSHLSRIGRIGLTDYAHQKPGRIDQVWEIISIKIGLGRIYLSRIGRIGLTDYALKAWPNREAIRDPISTC